MKVRNTTTGETLRLEELPFAKGGEGLLYKIIAPNDYLTFVAKIYHPDKRTAQREHKLRYLIKHPPVFENEEQASLVSWPIALLEKQQQFIGFLMPCAKGELLEILATAQLPKSLPKKWQRFKLGTVSALKLRQKVCFNIAVALYHIHQTGRYVMVDLKPDNILIQENGLVSLVDMDSVEIVNGDQVLFPAAMATPEFAPPEFHFLNRTTHGISTNWDQFSMAIIFYKILLGIHPFAATSKGQFEDAVSLGEKLKHGLYVHNKACQRYLEIIPSFHTAFTRLPIVIQSLFNLCFIDGIQTPNFRPNAEEWCLALGETKREEKIIIYNISNTNLELNVPQLTFSQNSMFETSFEVMFGKVIEQELPQIIKKISENNKSWNLGLWEWLSLISILMAIGGYWFLWQATLLFLSCGVVFLGISYYKKNKANNVLSKKGKRLMFPNLKIEKKWQPLFNQKVEHLFEVYQAQKKIHQQLISTYYQEVDLVQREWEQACLLAKRKCTLLNRENREKVTKITQERNEQLLWKQFVGETVEQKQNFLKKKYLPNQLQQLTKNQQQQVQYIDEKYQLSWRNLENNFYKKLEEIDRTIVQQKVHAKAKEEQEFIIARQKIIDAIQEQKKATQETYEAQQKLTKTSVKHYCEELEEIEALAMNKKIVLKQAFDLKFQRLINGIEEGHKEADESLKKLQSCFLTEDELLLKPILEAIKELGMSGLKFVD